MKRVPIPDEVFERGRAEHPDALKPLSAFQSITAICDDCGHTKVLDREQLLAMTAVSTFGNLWRHAYCSQCRNAGTARTSITLHGLAIDRHGKPKLKPHWVNAAVFGDDRSDPYPTLPRRSLIKDEEPV